VVQAFVEDLLDKGWVRMLCSDAHGDRHFDALARLQTHAGLKHALSAGDWVQRGMLRG
jgi:predicted phosphodiesterase